MANYTTNKINLGGRSDGNVTVNSSSATDMIITPDAGYVVRASDFTNVDDSDELPTVVVGNPADTGIAYAIGNTVRIPISLSSYVMPSSDKKLIINITGDAVLFESLAKTIPVNFTVNNDLTTGAASGVVVTVSGSNGVTVTSTTPGTDDFSFSGNATFNPDEEQTEVGQVVLTVDETGTASNIILEFNNSNTSNSVATSSVSSVSVGDIVTGTNVPAGTFVTAVTQVGSSTNSTISLSETLNGTITLTFTQDQFIDQDALLEVLNSNNNVSEEKTDKNIIIVPSSTVTNTNGTIKSVTLKLFSIVNRPILKSDNFNISLTGTSKSFIRSKKIKAVTFGGLNINPSGETRTIKVFGDIGAKVSLSMVDSAGTAANVFPAVSNAEIVSSDISFKGQGVFEKVFTIPEGKNGSALNGFTPPFKLNIDAGTATIKDDAIVSGTPDYTINQHAYPKITITTSRGSHGGSLYTLPASKVVIGRPNTPASELNYLKTSGDTIDIEYVLVTTTSFSSITNVTAVADSNITGLQSFATVASAASSVNSIVLSPNIDGVANKVATIKFTLNIGTWGTSSHTYSVKLAELINVAGS
jgi:hypothetical protein